MLSFLSSFVWTSTRSFASLSYSIFNSTADLRSFSLSFRSLSLASSACWPKSLNSSSDTLLLASKLSLRRSSSSFGSMAGTSAAAVGPSVSERLVGEKPRPATGWPSFTADLRSFSLSLLSFSLASSAWWPKSLSSSSDTLLISAAAVGPSVSERLVGAKPRPATGWPSFTATILRPNSFCKKPYGSVGLSFIKPCNISCIKARSPCSSR